MTDPSRMVFGIFHLGPQLPMPSGRKQQSPNARSISLLPSFLNILMMTAMLPALFFFFLFFGGFGCLLRVWVKDRNNFKKSKLAFCHPSNHEAKMGKGGQS